MPDLGHELYVLVSLAKLDAELNEAQTELARMPAQIDKLDKSIADIEKNEQEASGHLEDMQKERREIEQKLQDNQEQIKKYRVQLMQVKTNKEYTAMLNEIGHLEKDIDAKEERLLLLMDELENQSAQNKDYLATTGADKQRLVGEKKKLEQRMEELNGEAARVEGEKPKLLAELPTQIRKRYDRLLKKLGSLAVTHIVDDTCQGCFRRIPPQTAVEVRQNTRIITCEGCGRILVHYEA